MLPELIPEGERGHALLPVLLVVLPPALDLVAHVVLLVDVDLQDRTTIYFPVFLAKDTL